MIFSVAHLPQQRCYNKRAPSRSFSRPLMIRSVAASSRPFAARWQCHWFHHSGANDWRQVVGVAPRIAPRVDRVALLFNPAQAPTAEYYLNSFKAAATSFGVQANATQVRDSSEFEPIIAAGGPNGGLALVPDAFMTAYRVEIVSLAARLRVPVVYPFRVFAESGGLISYGPDLVDQFRHAAVYVDRVLKGAKANDLPVQGPTKFELAAQPQDRQGARP